MENRYDKIMKNIEVATEMQDRIMSNINNLNLNKISKRDAHSYKYRKYIYMAACFMMLFVGAVIVRSMINVTNQPPLQVIPDISKHNSAEELSEAVGFDVKEIQDIPFHVETIQYSSYWKELAEVKYMGQNNTVVLRMATGDEDVSGDYGEYNSIKSHRMKNYSVTIKGNDDQYSLAIWQSDGFSYSIKFTEAISQEKILTIVQSLM